MFFRAEAVQRHILLHEVHRLGGAVDGIDVRRAGIQGVDGKTAGIAEQVQHILPGGVAADERAVFALVEEKARLLPLAPIHKEAVAVLQHGHFVRRKSFSLIEVTIDQLKSSFKRRSAGTLVVNGLQRLAVDRLERLADLPLGAEHTDRMGLQHADAVVIIDDESGQVVALAVHQPVASGRPAADQPHDLAGMEGGADAVRPERRLQRGVVIAEDADGDGTDLIVAIGEKTPVGGENPDDIALGGRTDDLRDSPGEDPGMETHQRGLTPLPEVDFVHAAELVFRIRALRGDGGGAWRPWTCPPPAGTGGPSGRPWRRLSRRGAPRSPA